MATFPNTGFVKVKVKRIRRQGQQTAFDLSRYVQDYNTAKWLLEGSLPPMRYDSALVTTWLNFFKDTNGMENAFTVDMTEYVPNEPSLTAVSFKMLSPDDVWEKDDDGFFSFNFAAREV